MTTEKTKNSAHGFFAYAQEQINQLTAEGRFGTAQTYAKTLRSFRAFLQEDLAGKFTPETLTLERLDSYIIIRYDKYLAARGVVRNSISFYNRVLRAIYNKAVRKYRMPDRHPFLDSYTGVEKTHNRAISESTISRLMTLDLSAHRSLELTRDLFIFSYMARGISFVDMAYLKKSDVHDGYIIYHRKKTGARLEVRLEPQLRRIIQKYSAQTRGSEYLLPILNGCSGDAGRAYRLYQSRLATYNRCLKELGRLLHCALPLPLTSYVSRHSWATAARNAGVSMGIISEGLGHSSERTTRIYLGSFNCQLIDRAGRRMMDRLGYKTKFVSPRETNNGHKGYYFNDLTQFP